MQVVIGIIQAPKLKSECVPVVYKLKSELDDYLYNVVYACTLCVQIVDSVPYIKTMIMSGL